MLNMRNFNKCVLCSIEMLIPQIVKDEVKEDKINDIVKFIKKYQYNFNDIINDKEKIVSISLGEFEVKKYLTLNTHKVALDEFLVYKYRYSMLNKPVIIDVNKMIGLKEYGLYCVNIIAWINVEYKPLLKLKNNNIRNAWFSDSSNLLKPAIKEVCRKLNYLIYCNFNNISPNENGELNYINEINY